QDLEVLGNRRLAHVERPGQLVHRSLPGGQPGEDRPPGGVGQGGERRVQGCHRAKPISYRTFWLYAPGPWEVKEGRGPVKSPERAHGGAAAGKLGTGFTAPTIEARVSGGGVPR